MTIQVLYRTRNGSNDKLRPEWFSRAACLASMRIALEAVGQPAALTFVADGGMPEDLSRHVGPADSVRRITAGTAASSLRSTISIAAEIAAQAPDDFFWLAEDDYVYQPDAFVAMMGALKRLPEADYFSLFQARPTDWADIHPSQPTRTVPQLPVDRTGSDGVDWYRSPGTTSTFGCFGSTLLADGKEIILGTRAGAPFDGPTWCMLAGVPPYSWRHLFADIEPYFNARGLAKIVGKPMMRVALNVKAKRRPESTQRLLMVPVDNLAVHLEAFEVEGDPRWQQLSESARRRIEP